MSDKFIFSKLNPLADHSRIEDMLETIKDHYSFVETDILIADSVRQFEMIEEYTEAQFLLAFRSITKPAYHLLFVLLRNVYPEQHFFYPNEVMELGAPMQPQIFYSIDDVTVFGLMKVKNDFGDVFIRPETLQDKLIELVDHEEVRMPEYPTFNKKYYVLAKDKEKLLRVISDEFVSSIEHLQKAYIEIHHNHLLVGFKRNPDEESILALSDFLNNIAEKAI